MLWECCGRSCRLLVIGWALVLAQPAAAQFSLNELHLQRGRIEAPGFAGGGRHATTILTFQHASADAWTQRFYFIDFARDGGDDGFNDNDFYGEFYATLSLSRLLGRSLRWGPIADAGLQLGLNMGAQAKLLKSLPGLRLSLTLPGFAMAALELNAYTDHSSGLAAGGAPAQSDSWHVNVAWVRPFVLAGQSFSIEGHAEYIASRRNELGQAVSWWLLAQPQLRWDVGAALGATPGHWFAGVEWQWWQNKLGDPATDENVLQALLVWRF